MTAETVGGCGQWRDDAHTFDRSGGCPAPSGFHWRGGLGVEGDFAPIRFPCASQTPSGINDVEITLIIISRSYFQIEDILIVTFIS